MWKTMVNKKGEDEERDTRFSECALMWRVVGTFGDIWL
jgi:hypothetical protein